MSRPQANRDVGRTVLSVAEITRDIKNNLEGTFYNLWVAGELSNLKTPSSGHSYFTLRDDKAQLPAVMWRSAARNLRFRPTDGMAVLVWGHITVYEPRGAYQFQVERMEPRGKGALQIAFEQLKDKLSKEGLFDRDRKRPLPAVPRRIAVVTSPSGAALKDFCRVAVRRFDNLDITVYPAQVQGELAAADIATGVRAVNRLGGYDVIVVTRGGGSLEDLWPFNEESVARAIAASAIPVVSAVGHEVDVTISDYVADLRAPTPSAAAELVIPAKRDLKDRVSALSSRADKNLRGHLRDLTARVSRMSTHRAFAAVQHGVQLRGQRVDEATGAMRTAMDLKIRRLGRRVSDARNRLERQRVEQKLAAQRNTLTELRARLDAAELKIRQSRRGALGTVAARLEVLSPLGVLGRGYSLTWTAQGKLLRRARDASEGDAVRVQLGEGALDCRVESVEDEKR